MFSFYWISALASLTSATSVLRVSETGFTTISNGFSAGGHADCITGLVPVTITATNSKLALSEPANQTVVTEIVQELVQIDSTIAARTVVGQAVVSGTYQIEATLCIPADAALAAKLKTVQILTHGIGLEKSYWDIAPDYSHVDAAAAAGYATLAYNRLGVGRSDHPDPIQVVQSPADVEILHELTQLLRAGKIGSRSFKNVIGVGQSYGSLVQLAQNAKYPQDVDAAVLTSFTSRVQNLPCTISTNHPTIANVNDPSRFGSLPPGYLVHETPISVQLPFFRHPFFDQKIFDAVYAAKDTYTLGQQFTLSSIFGPARAFKGPVDVVVGQHDFPFCLGQCDVPTDQASATISALYPFRGPGSSRYIIPDVGHLFNAHYKANLAFNQINSFVRANRF
ncbi:MAG: hypothetical protein Q9219_003498 [cf. Caloplaca sp. 3 TL-2023]